MAFLVDLAKWQLLALIFAVALFGVPAVLFLCMWWPK